MTVISFILELGKKFCLYVKLIEIMLFKRQREVAIMA